MRRQRHWLSRIVMAMMLGLGSLGTTPALAKPPKKVASSDLWNNTRSQSIVMAEVHAERQPELGQTAFGLGGHFIQQETAADATLRIDARLSSQHPVADASAPRQNHGVIGEVDGNMQDFKRHLYLGLKLAEGSALHFEGASLRAGVSLGSPRYSVSLFAGESVSKEYVQDMLALTGLVGVQVQLQPTDWLQLRALFDAGLVAGTRREAGMPAPILRAQALAAAAPTGPGSHLDGRVQALIKIKDFWVFFAEGRMRRVEIPTGAQPETSTSVGGNFGVGAAF